MSFLAEDAWSLVYDGEEVGAEGGEGGEGTEGGEGGEEKIIETKKEAVQTKVKSFSQDEVNKILAEDRRKNQKNRDQLVQQLKTLSENKGLTEKEKDELAARIEQLQTETMTAQELAKKDKEKLQKEYSKELEKERQNRERIWNKYSQEKITREIQDEAQKNDAISSIQIVNLLQPFAKLIDELNKDGQPTGEWATRVAFRDKDEKGATITLELSVTDAVKRMKEMPEHWNLFKSGANGGLGAFNAPQSVIPRGGRPPSDHKQYLEWRKANNIPGSKQ